jgi:hypothetical protein
VCNFSFLIFFPVSCVECTRPGLFSLGFLVVLLQSKLGIISSIQLSFFFFYACLEIGCHAMYDTFPWKKEEEGFIMIC